MRNHRMTMVHHLNHGIRFPIIGLKAPFGLFFLGEFFALKEKKWVGIVEILLFDDRGVCEHLLGRRIFEPRKACECIAAIGATDVMDNLPDLFNDEAPSVRQAALEALTTHPDIGKFPGKNKVLVVKCARNPEEFKSLFPNLLLKMLRR